MCVFTELTLSDQTKISSSKMQLNAERTHAKIVGARCYYAIRMALNPRVDIRKTS